MATEPPAKRKCVGTDCEEDASALQCVSTHLSEVDLDKTDPCEAEMPEAWKRELFLHPRLLQ